MNKRKIKINGGFSFVDLLVFIAVIAIIAAIAIPSVFGMAQRIQSKPVSSSGVQKANVQVKTDIDGLTIEQKNVRDRLLEDNKPGSIKHLYVLSPYSGQALLYSTVMGKVTSGGKRLTPKTVTATAGEYVHDAHSGMYVNINGRTVATPEVLQDDGTYGDSGDYIFWMDSKGIYHQHYLTGGQIIHISSEPLPVSSVTINLEQR